MYTLCKLMKWNHLPAPGGIYGQRPKFLDDMLIIAAAEGEAERKRLERQKKDQAKKGPRPRRRRR